MIDFKEFLSSIDEPAKRLKMESILDHIRSKYPHLKEEVKWNQPMFSDHGTFIIGFSIAKNNIAVAPEAVVLRHFIKEIEKAGYTHTQQLMRIKWSDEVDYGLLDQMIDFNIEEKKEMTKFWR